MRAFVAVDVSDAGARLGVGRVQEGLLIDASPVPPGNLHFTLQFLGEISESRAQDAVRALRGIRFRGFDVRLCGLGAFPSARRPRVVWAGVDDAGAAGLAGLARMVAGALEPLGFAPAGEFSPHLTIFRIKKKIGDITSELESAGRAHIGTQRVSGIALKRSDPGPGGPAYSDVGGVGESP